MKNYQKCRGAQDLGKCGRLVKCVLILVEKQPPKVIFICDHAGRMINQCSLGWANAPWASRGVAGSRGGCGDARGRMPRPRKSTGPGSPSVRESICESIYEEERGRERERDRGREKVCVCVFVCVRERERESVCACVRERDDRTCAAPAPPAPAVRGNNFRDRS